MYKTKYKKPNRFRKPGGHKSLPKGKTLDLTRYVNSDIKPRPTEKYLPDHGFDDFYLNENLLSQIRKKGFKTPSEIQDKAIPLIMAGQNLVGVAGTGTGKTAAFLIPIIQELISEKADHTALIITPTRELARQINDDFRSLSRGLGIYSTCLIGGTSVSESIKSLRRTNHLIIGTPGRLLDMHKQGFLPFDRFRKLVLDEFDRMLDMGFKEEMRTINKKMINKKQTLLFSATVDESQRKIMSEITGKAMEVRAAMDIQKTDAIRQEILHANGQNKFQLMHDLLLARPDDKVILFCETKRKADRMVKKLLDRKVTADAIHGDKSQRAREVALRKFKHGKVNVLVATDVVARGIDVTDVALVINYEVPRNYTDYIHRIGRTGRAGKTGRAITIID